MEMHARTKSDFVATLCPHCPGRQSSLYTDEYVTIRSKSNSLLHIDAAYNRT